MYALKHWVLDLCTSSFRVRICIVSISFPIFLGLSFLFFPITHNPTVAIIPILFSSWLFKYRGMLISVLITAIVMTTLNDIFLPTLFPWPLSLIAPLIGLLVGSFIGLLICFLRYAFDLVVESRLKVLQAEHDKMLADEQQREAQEAERCIKLAYEQQQQINQQKDLFLAHINHELCTPLVTVSGYLELLLEYNDQLDEEKKSLYLQQALEGAQELNQLVNNLLDAAQFTAGRFSPTNEKISLAHAAQEVLSQWNPRDRYDFTFHVDVPDTLMVWADRNLLAHVLRNLLSNACKYAPRQTNIYIQAACNPADEGKQVRLSVKDEGKGIPPAQKALLFEKFVRLPQDITGGVRGTGLGLYISRQFVEAMGGHIWVESSGHPKEGSCFSFTLPTFQPKHVAVLQ
jgi:signal transduction histidine kinase